jgi:hypothetical protein
MNDDEEMILKLVKDCQRGIYRPVSFVELNCNIFTSSSRGRSYI